MILDEFLPEYDINMVHSIEIAATPEMIYRALRELEYRELSSLVNMLFAIRRLPERLFRKAWPQFQSDTPFLDQMINGPFVMLADSPNTEFVFGLIVPGNIGRFWKHVDYMFAPKLSVQEFIDFDRTGYVKVAANFLVGQPDSRGLVSVSTESRIKALSPAARKGFKAYWTAIYPGSWLIRKMWLKAIKRRAERI